MKHQSMLPPLLMTIGIAIAVAITTAYVFTPRPPESEPLPRAPFRVVREFNTLTGAMAHAREGDTIEIGPGTYEFGSMTITQPVVGKIIIPPPGRRATSSWSW